VPRGGLPQSNKIKLLRTGATAKLPTAFQGFPARGVAPFGAAEAHSSAQSRREDQLIHCHAPINGAEMACRSGKRENWTAGLPSIDRKLKPRRVRLTKQPLPVSASGVLAVAEYGGLPGSANSSRSAHTDQCQTLMVRREKRAGTRSKAVGCGETAQSDLSYLRLVPRPENSALCASTNWRCRLRKPAPPAGHAS
jgi:hypothetical protein